MADIFISYSRKDKPIAEQLEQALEQCGWSVFWDGELLPGETFRRAIEQELQKARLVIALWSPTSIKSEWVIDEAESGKRNSRLLSVRVDEIDMPLGFRQSHAASLIGWNGDTGAADFQALIRRLRDLIPLDSAPAAPSADPPLPKARSDFRIGGTSSRGSTSLIDHPPDSRLARLALRHPAAEPTVLLAVVFLLNWAQTSLDELLTPRSLGAGAGYPLADAFQWFERYLSFELHDTTSAVAYYGYTASYFVIFPALCLYVAWALALKRDPRPYQAVSLAVAIDYLVSVPFFIFFPVPERWAAPTTEAMLLSDKVSVKLIEFIRPISGLDNSFPSFHVSLTVLVVAACFMFRVPLRMTALAFGAIILLSTFVLGVHWIPDVIAGVALGLASMLLAWRIVERGYSPFLARWTPALRAV